MTVKVIFKNVLILIITIFNKTFEKIIRLKIFYLFFQEISCVWFLEKTYFMPLLKRWTYQLNYINISKYILFFKEIKSMWETNFKNDYSFKYYFLPNNLKIYINKHKLAHL
jgi:hypothetical protein